MIVAFTPEEEEEGGKNQTNQQGFPTRCTLDDSNNILFGTTL